MHGLGPLGLLETLKPPYDAGLSDIGIDLWSAQGAASADLGIPGIMSSCFPLRSED